jgi:hypothetical protein
MKMLNKMQIDSMEENDHKIILKSIEDLIDTLTPHIVNKTSESISTTLAKLKDPKSANNMVLNITINIFMSVFEHFLQRMHPSIDKKTFFYDIFMSLTMALGFGDDENEKNTH